MLILNILMTILATTLAIPVLWFCVQNAFAVWSEKTRARQSNPSNTTPTVQSIAVLIPAHNESINLIPTLHSIAQQGMESLRVLVVADNCSDDTAAIAQREGVEVIERSNLQLRGKGYALDFGVQHLARNPPAVVIILDADCLLEPKVLQPLSELAIKTNRPVQALYLMKNSGECSVKAKIAEFAWLVKNKVRPRGLHALGLPCQLTGSGMAFPWAVIQAVPLATGEIVEDMKLGMALADLGHPPVFSEHTVVTSTFPVNAEGIQSQRTRWEHGHLSMLLKEGLPTLFNAAMKRNPSLFFLALDLCIPPLALLVILTLAWQVLATIFWIWTGNAVPFLTGAIYLILTGSAVTAAWCRFGQHLVSGRELLMAPGYIVSKWSVYLGFIFRRQSEWIRSKRDNEKK